MDIHCSLALADCKIRYSLISSYLLDISSYKANYYLRKMIGYPI